MKIAETHELEEESGIVETAAGVAAVENVESIMGWPVASIHEGGVARVICKARARTIHASGMACTAGAPMSASVMEL